MSFVIQAAGLVADAVRQVEAAEGVPNAQFEAVRAFVLAELAAWPTDTHSPRGVIVEASGHRDTNSYHVSVVIRPLWLRGDR